MHKLILLLLPALALAQFTKGKVTDSITGEPIPYANIWVENEDISAMADSLGQFSIKTTNADKTLVFSAAGYHWKDVKLPESRDLKLRPIEFPECLPRTKNTKTTVLGSDYKIRKSDLTFGSQGRPWMMARKFLPPANLDQTPYLEKLTLYTNCHNNNMKLSLRFFEIDENGQPGKDLTDKLVIFRVDLGRENTTVDLSKYDIRIPEKGLFIAVSWMIIHQNIKVWFDRRPMAFKDYDPGIGVMPSEVNSSWQYRAGKWTEMARFPSNFDMRAYREKFAEIAMKVTLSN